MPNWRLLPISACSGAMNMAIDEAMLHARAMLHACADHCVPNTPNTLRFFTWNPPAITIGFFQSMEAEVDVEKAAGMGIDVVRRYTGGGAVFHDRELTYSLVIPESDLTASHAKDSANDIIESYRQICGCIILGLKSLGINAEFHPINDIVVNGKKVSGNAQTRQNGIILQHGTILLDVDVDKMFSVLKVPSEKLRGKMIESVKERVTALSEQTEPGREKITIEQLQDALIHGFEAGLGAEFVIGALTEGEKEMAEKLCREKYKSREWNFSR